MKKRHAMIALLVGAMSAFINAIAGLPTAGTKLRPVAVVTVARE